MIHLTRLRHGETFYLNPDMFERVDTHVDTVIRLTDGTEYVVVEPAEEIVRRIAEFRARIIALAAVFGSTAFAAPDGDPTERTTARHGAPVGELPLAATAAPADDEPDPVTPPAEHPA